MRLRSYLLLFISLVPVLIFRDYTPNNELKYLSIVDEALRNGHFFTFYNQGEVYADKPPLYFWLLMAVKYITGSYCMFFLSLFSIIPAFVVMYIMNKWSFKVEQFRLKQTSSLMLITSALFVGSGLVLRMDMLMCMFIVLSLYTFFKMYRGDYRVKNRILLPIYIFLAIFSKGPLGFIIPVLSILVFLIWKKEIKKFFVYMGGLQWLILIGLCGLWFLCVYFEGGKEYLNNLLFHQTINRAVDSFHHKKPIWYFFITIWYSLAPWAILYISIIAIGIKKNLIVRDKEKFFLTIILTTFICLSVFSSKLDIYMLPAFPFFTYLTALLLPKIQHKCISFALFIPIVAIVLALPVFYIWGGKLDVPNSIVIQAAVWILCLGGVLALISLMKKRLITSINILSCAILLTIFVGGFAVPSLNSSIGFSALAQRVSAVMDENEVQNVYFYRFRSGENMDVLIDKHLDKIADEEELRGILSRTGNLVILRESHVREMDGILKLIFENSVVEEGEYYIVVTK